MSVDDQLLDLLTEERRLEEERQGIAARRLDLRPPVRRPGQRYKDLMALLDVFQSRASQLIQAAKRH